MLKVGIQGLAASYSDAALSTFMPKAERLLYDSFAEVFDELKTGTLDRAFLPFENSTAGFIAENFQLLEQSGVFVSAECIHKVEHCLLAPKGMRLADINGVLSHPQALAQCSRLFAQETFKAVPWFDTAGAARDVSLLQNKAAIASAGAAAVYGLDILKRGVNDEIENYTRFFLIGKELNWGRRVLLACDISDVQDILASTVKLVTILTRPMPSAKWGHRLYLELEAPSLATWPEWTKCFPQLKILGSFDSQR